MKENEFNNPHGSSNANIDAFVNSLQKLNFDFATGIPCGVQNHIIKKIKKFQNLIHITSNSEQEAIGIATGAYLTGKIPIVYMQNSGFFASSNDIASLLVPYKIPLLFIVTWRGLPNENAPQHKVTGNTTKKLLSSMGLDWEVLTKKNSKVLPKRAMEVMNKTMLPFIILIKRGWDR